VQCPLLALLSRHDERAAECLLSGGKADMTKRKYPLLRSLLGVKRTLRFAPQMSAFDPKRTFELDP
jgi:hypothetical protein